MLRPPACQWSPVSNHVLVGDEQPSNDGHAVVGSTFLESFLGSKRSGFVSHGRRKFWASQQQQHAWTVARWNRQRCEREHIKGKFYNAMLGLLYVYTSYYWNIVASRVYTMPLLAFNYLLLLFSNSIYLCKSFKVLNYFVLKSIVGNCKACSSWLFMHSFYAIYITV